MRAARKEERLGERRRSRRREFHKVGAAKENERRPEQDFTKGIERSEASEDLRLRAGL